MKFENMQKHIDGLEVKLDTSESKRGELKEVISTLETTAMEKENGN